MKRDKAALPTVLLGIFVSLFIFAPIAFGWHATNPPDVNVIINESPGCQSLGIGTVYVYGQSINGNGQPVAASNYQWMGHGCGIVP